ncbi:hypothetical protein [Halocatena halophila]|uniref:hypothetical protein n=1 Tax=Halocatena halophila TaxID=2814576 RepID=UPI002ECFCF8F
MKGLGGLAMVSLSNRTAATSWESLVDSSEIDPHTNDTYQSLVDVILPETPALEEEFGPNHVPGALNIGLDQYVIWQLDHCCEVRLERLAHPSNIEPLQLPDKMMDPQLFEIVLDTSNVSSDLAAVNEIAPVDLTTVLPNFATLEEALEFGAVEQFEIMIDNDLSADESGPATFARTVKTPNETFEQTIQSFPYASLLSLVWDIVAADAIASPNTGIELSTTSQQIDSGGGTFTQLLGKDRLRALWRIIDTELLTELAPLLSVFVPRPGILRYILMMLNALSGFGYYSEWAGYGESKTAPPTRRELTTPPDEIQGHSQTGYPGPAAGYAIDWEHLIDGGFDDPPASELKLPDDLTGGDVIGEIGGGAE